MAEHDGMPLKNKLALAALGLTLGLSLGLAAPASAQTEAARTWQRYPAAREVQLRDVAAIVQVMPENRTDVAVLIHNPGGLPAPELRMRGDRLVVDGGLRRQIRSCGGEADNFRVTTSRHGRLARTQLTMIELRVPRSLVLAASGGLQLNIGPSQSAKVALEGCGVADIEQVEDKAELAVAGAPDVRLYGAGTAEIAVSGGGDVTVGAVRDGLAVSIAGAGDFVAARVDGPTSIAVQGAGDVTIRDGRATTLSVAILGAGDVIHNGSAQRLDAAIMGAGDVRVRHVEGEVNRRVLGAGEVVVGR